MPRKNPFIPERKGSPPLQLEFFEQPESSGVRPPLATRVRPETLQDYVGQQHLLGPGKPLRNLLEAGQWSTSLVFWGPPGCGKTTLARLIAHEVGLPFQVLSAVESGVKELRAISEKTRATTLLFIDEIHRYGKTQQDALLPHLESGLFRLVGATTESPASCLTPALLSRCKVYSLRPLGQDELLGLLQRALEHPAGLAELSPVVSQAALERLVQLSRGDARRALELLSQATLSAPLDAQGQPKIAPEWIDAQLPEPTVSYGEKEHYALASAWIKSIRGSDPQAALYWLARMVAGGEPVDFLARRLRIAAGEDVGLADPQAMVHTEACCSAAERVGYPEARYPLAQATLYLSLAPKSDSLNGYFQAEQCARQTDHLRVPNWLAPGGAYHNPHQEPQHFRPVTHLPPELAEQRFYRPGALGYEIKLRQRIDQLWPEE